MRSYWGYCRNYNKDNSPKAREIFRLAEMAMESSDVKTTAPGVQVRLTEGLWIEKKDERKDWRSIELWTHYTYQSCTMPGHNHPKEPQKSRMLLKAVTHREPCWHGGTRSHIVFYNKKESDFMLHELHKKLPLEGLAYYGEAS